MIKKAMAVLTAALMILGTTVLAAQQDETAIKKVIPDALNALGNLELEKAWSYWCDDGFLEKNGSKQTIADLKKSPQYVKLLELSKMKNAKNVDELTEMLVKSGDITPEQKNTFVSLPEEKKKEMFSAMQQALKMQQGMMKMAFSGMVSTMKYKSFKIEGDTAVAMISLNGPLAGGGDAIVTFKKVKNVWKVYSVQDVLSHKAEEKGEKE